MKKIIILAILLCVCAAETVFANTSVEDVEINLITELGLLKKYDDGTFRKEEYATCADLDYAVAVMSKSETENNEKYSEALTADEMVVEMVHLLGYYGENYKKIASEAGIYKGTKLYGGYVTREDFSKIIYNTLLADKFQLSGMNNEKITFEKHGNLLWDVFKIERVIGIAEADSTAYIDNFIYGLKKNEIMISGIRVSGISDTKNYLARRVEAFLRFEDDSKINAQAVLVNKYKNDEIKITSEFIDGATTSGCVVWMNSGNEKLSRKKIPSDAVVIYNGNRLGKAIEQEWSIFTPADGEVNIIDNDGDGEAEAIIIWSYIPYVVDYVNVSNSIIYDKIGRTPINLEDREYTVFDGNGKETKIDTLKPYDVISVSFGKNEDDEIIIRISSANPVSGKYTRDGYSIFIDRDEYSLSGWCDLNGAKNGEKITAYLDIYNRPVYIERISDLEYGYLSSVNYDIDSESIYFKLYTFEKGVKKYESAEKITVYEQGVKTKYIRGKNGENSFKVLNELISHRQELVKFRLNSDEEIKEIHFPDNKIYQNMPDNDVDFSVYYAIDSSESPQFRTAKFLQNTLASRCIITQNTKMMSVEGNSQNIEKFKRISLDDLISDGDYDVIVYDLNEKFEAGAVIFKTVDTIDSRYSNFGSIVGSVTEAAGDGGEKLLQISVYTLGEKKILYADNPDLISDEVVADKFQNRGTKLSEIKSGDVIYYTLDCDERISSFAVLHKNNDGEFYYRSNYGWGGNYIPNAAMAVTYCRVEKTYSDLIIADIDGLKPILPNQWRHYYIYEKSKNKLKQAEFSDVKPGDKIVGLWKWSNMNDLIIYR